MMHYLQYKTSQPYKTPQPYNSPQPSSHILQYILLSCAV